MASPVEVTVIEKLLSGNIKPYYEIAANKMGFSFFGRPQPGDPDYIQTGSSKKKPVQKNKVIPNKPVQKKKTFPSVKTKPKSKPSRK